MTTTLQFLKTLYLGLLKPMTLLIWTLTLRIGNRQSFWTSTVEEAADHGHRVRRTREVFFAVALHDSGIARAAVHRRWPSVRLPRVRGCHDSAIALPAIWAELKLTEAGSYPEPDFDAVRRVFKGAPRPPSIIVWNGSGYVLYWLLDQLWILDSDEEKQRAKDLLRRHQASLRDAAQTLGCRILDTADLARSHPLPGTLYRQADGSKKAVKVGHFPLDPHSSDDRYRPSDFDDLPPVPRRPSRPAEQEAIRIEPVREGCRWLQHCEEEQDQVDEEEWLAALQAVGDMHSATQDRLDLAHDYSHGHPGYNPLKTEEKLEYAMHLSEPLTCVGIEDRFDPEGRFCGRCPYRGLIETPLDLGREGAPRPELEPEPEREPERVAARSVPGASPLIVVVFNTVETAKSAANTEAPGVEEGHIEAADVEEAAQVLVHRGPVPNLIHGLGSLLERLGGAATAREIVDELERSGEDFLALRAALEALIPQLQPGDLPRSIDLAGRLRAFRGRIIQGASIEKASRDYKGTRWRVRRAA